MSKLKLILCSLFFISIKAQFSKPNEPYKKCKKEFSKKICISDEDGDRIPFYLDKCPKEPGKIENSGCPWMDSDGDGLPDKDDLCPEVIGPIENNGCPWPDTDGDGILDKDDEYPLIQSNCEVIYEERRKQVEEFMINFKDIPFEGSFLKKTIDNINSKHILTPSIAIVLYEEGHFANDHGPCPQFFTNKKTLFLYQKKWTLESIKYLQKKINKDIFFIIAGTWNTSAYLTEEVFNEKTYIDNNFANFDFIRHFPMTKINDKEVYYLPKTNSSVKSFFLDEDISSLGVYENGYSVQDKKNKSYVIRNYEIIDGKLVLKFYEWRKGNYDIYERFPK